MTDDKMMLVIEKVVKELDQAVEDYLQWMAESGYARSTQEVYARGLKQFSVFIKQRRCTFEAIFTEDTLRQFKKTGKSYQRPAIYGLSRYLFDQKKIPRPLSVKDDLVKLPTIYEDYLAYYQQKESCTDRNRRQTRRVLFAFHDYLQKEKIDLMRLVIEHVDAFLAQFFAPFKPSTQRAYRSKLRGFLTYLYLERNIIKRDLASFIVAKRHYGLSKPPKFLRPDEIQKLFAGFSLSSDSEIRTYAMMQLAYSLGLRPQEVALIRLDDICFSKAELTLTDRKNNRPIVLPIPDTTLKAVATYRIAVRPQSEHNTLFLSLHPPYRPVSPNTIGQH
ncbi:MAG: tyrosine-type recombinase/integrase, partial [Desulfobacterales bacterium]|nr:tyrosine-type recombinase/integrase [Desulfobacterales bacterium]